MRVFTPICKIPRAHHQGYKFPKLTELSDFLEIYPYDITRKTIEFYGSVASFHDARFDTVTLYLAVVNGAKLCQELASQLNLN
jgi:hypothetical protein